MKLCAGLLVALACSGVLASEATRHTLTFEERVKAQEAIEQVSWSHRVWPKENSDPKPPLASVMPDEAIRAKVEDYLKKSNALAKFWQRPITAEQLQAETDRMVANTRDPETLRELFAALGNDPRLIAETLARQTLADRLIRNWYASDERFHGDVRTKAESALQQCADDGIACMRAQGADVQDLSYVVDRDSQSATSQGGDLEHDGGRARVVLSESEWTLLIARLAAQVGAGAAPELGRAADRKAHRANWARSNQPTLNALTLDVRGSLVEENDRFVAVKVLRKEEHELEVSIVSWPKRSFDDWWTGQRNGLSRDLAKAIEPRSLAQVQVTTSTTENWTAMPIVPPQSNLHTSVWTGTEMLVWGGSYGDPGGGSSYTPATDTWVATSSRPGVTGRHTNHTAVWTGTEMLVWGAGPDPRRRGANQTLRDHWRAQVQGELVRLEQHHGACQYARVASGR